MSICPRQVGDRIALYRVRYGQDMAFWENDFEGMEFSITKIFEEPPTNWKYQLVTYGFGLIRYGDDKAYGGGAIYVYENELSSRQMVVGRILKEMGYERRTAEKA